MSDDDDLRFGDVSGSQGSGSSEFPAIIELMIQGFVGLIILYVLLSTAEILFEIQIPFV